MYADSLEELHAMAKKIGMKRAWFQDHKSLQHYDLVSNKRRLALEAGAVDHTRREAVMKWRELRQIRIAVTLKEAVHGNIA